MRLEITTDSPALIPGEAPWHLMGKIAKTHLLFLLIFAPLAFGTVETWSLAVMELGCLSGILFASFSELKSEGRLVSVPGLLPLLLVCGYMLFQVAPLPPMLVKAIAPGRWKLHMATAGLIDPLSMITISVHPRATLCEFFRFAAYAAFYILTVQLLSKGSQLRSSVSVVAVFGALLSVSAILQLFLTSHKALWFRQLQRDSMVVGPYVNHNHYAGLMEMIFPLVAALFVFYRPRYDYTSFRQKIVAMLSGRRANLQILSGAAAVIIALSVFLSLSRGGMISICLSMPLFILLLHKKRRKPKSGMLMLMILVMTASSMAWFGWDQVVNRFAALQTDSGRIYEPRLDFWKDSVSIISDFPLFGTGFGTFQDIYPRYKSWPGKLDLVHAHNDYIELLCNGGALGLALVCWFLGSLLIKTYPLFLKRRDPYGICLYAGALTGMAAILIHSVTDFNLQVGANGLYFFFLAGLAVAASTPSHQKSNSASPARMDKNTSRRITGLFLAVFAVGIVFNAGLVLGGIFFSTVQNTPVSIQSPPAWIAEVAESAGRAADSDPLNAGYRYAVGNSQALLGHPGQAETHYRKALFLQPLNSYIIEKMALIQAKQGKPAIASALFQSAIVFDRFNPHRYLTYAAWLFSADRTQEGAQMAREAIKRDPQSLDSALMLMVANGLGDMAIQSAIPKQGQSYLAYARFLSSMGKRQEAAMAFREAVAYVSADQPGAKTVLREVAAHYREQNHLEDALATMQVALSLFPKDPTLRFETGMLYEKTGIAYRAVQEYLVVLALEPGNLSARQRLDALGAK